MSRKSNRLKNRLRIEREQYAARERVIIAATIDLAREADRITKERRDLDRSVALRMRVERDFDRAMGPVWGLRIMIWPREVQLASMGKGFQDYTYIAGRYGHEAGHQIADVILRCLKGELEDFARAK